MARYKLVEVSPGKWLIWGRYQPVKGGRTQHKVVIVPRAKVPEAMMEVATWAADLRKGRLAD